MIEDQLTPALRQTLATVARAFVGADDPWWIISSAAVALHGAGPIEARDVDVLVSLRDARRFLAAQGIEAIKGLDHPLFRSELFGVWRAAPLPVEIMAGFQVYVDRRWTEVKPLTREAVELDGQRLFIPGRAELASMLRSFGRPKDLDRAALLTGSIPQPLYQPLPVMLERHSFRPIGPVRRGALRRKRESSHPFFGCIRQISASAGSHPRAEPGAGHLLWCKTLAAGEDRRCARRHGANSSASATSR